MIYVSREERAVFEFSAPLSYSPTIIRPLLSQLTKFCITLGGRPMHAKNDFHFSLCSWSNPCNKRGRSNGFTVTPPPPTSSKPTPAGKDRLFVVIVTLSIVPFPYPVTPLPWKYRRKTPPGSTVYLFCRPNSGCSSPHPLPEALQGRVSLDP